MLGTTFEHAARAPVPTQIRPGLLKYRMGCSQAASFTPLEYRTRPCSRYSRAAVSWSARLSAIVVRYGRFGLILFFNSLYIYYCFLIQIYFSAFSNIILKNSTKYTMN